MHLVRVARGLDVVDACVQCDVLVEQPRDGWIVATRDVAEFAPVPVDARGLRVLIWLRVDVTGASILTSAAGIGSQIMRMAAQ